MTTARWWITTLLAALAFAGCSMRRPLAPEEMSGFLDDYKLLRPGGTDEVRLVYRNPAADWPRYKAVIIQPVAIWRSGKKSLDPVPEEDLLRLAHDFEQAVRTRLGRHFRLVERPGPDVLLVRLAITQARASDAILDIATVPPSDEPSLPTGDTPLHAETKQFLDAAVIEGEIVDASSNALLAQGVDGPRRKDAPPLVTWGDVDRGLGRWADRVVGRLEARTGAESTK
jgi:hypothetical protein